MSNDLLFSVLPREGKVPIAHDELRVEKVIKDSAMRELTDQEQELHLEEREARQQQQQQSKSKKSPAEAPEEVANEENEPSSETNKTPKGGFKHLDIYV